MNMHDYDGSIGFSFSLICLGDLLFIFLLLLASFGIKAYCTLLALLLLWQQDEVGKTW